MDRPARLRRADVPGPPDRTGDACRHVVLVGLMGAGKTTVGRLVAARLARPFVDGDDVLRAEAGRDASRIAHDEGVAVLHAREARILLDALGRDDPSVIAPAASVVDDPTCRRALRQPGVLVVHLRASAETLARRAAGGAHRRAIGPDPAAAFRAQTRERAARFAAVRPAVTIDVDDRSPQETASHVLRALGQATGGSSTEA